MRRLFLLVAFVFAVALAGCGGHRVTTPLERALAHYPANAPLVAVVSTDVNDSQSLASARFGSRLPFVSGPLQRMGRLLSENRLNYTRDIAPWLGRQTVIGARRAEDIAKGRLLLALSVRDGRALRRVLKRLSGASGLGPAGKYRGAQLYRFKKDKVAVAENGNVLLLAGSISQLNQALATAASGAGFDLQKLTAATDGRHRGSTASLYLDVHGLIAARPDRGGSALRIPWVAALSTLGVTARPARDREAIELRFMLKSDRRDLNPEDVPIATGRTSPRLLVGPGGYFAASIRDLAHTIRFSEDAASALFPTGSALYEQAKTTLRDRLGVDIDQDLIDQLTGDSALVIGKGGFGTKARLRDPARMRRALAAATGVTAAALKVLGLGKRYRLHAARRGPSTIYELRGGGRALVGFGLVGRYLELRFGKIDPGSIRIVSYRSRIGAIGPGSLQFSADVGRLTRLLSRQLAALRSLSPYLKGLGRARGSVNARTRWMNGRLEVQTR